VAAGAGVVVCAKAEPARKSEAESARAAAREEIVIMEVPRKERKTGKLAP
jgi:hypothetical protein